MVDLPFPRVSAPPAPDAGVRRARADDAPSLAALQRTAWLTAYGDVLPPDALAALDGSGLEAQWAISVAAPPSAHHLVLVATSGADVVGYAVVVPDLDPDERELTAELADLVVARTRAGHGSRLLAAAVDQLRERGYVVLRAWSDDPDPARRRFLESAGLVADGAVRRLDTGDGTPALVQRRLVARLD